MFGGGFGGPRNYLADASGLPPGVQTFTGGQTTPVFQRPELPMINRQDTGLMQSGTGGGIGSFQMTGGNPQPTNPYSTGFGMGFQQQPNQQPMGGGKGGGRTEQRIDASSGPGKGG